MAASDLRLQQSEEIFAVMSFGTIPGTFIVRKCLRHESVKRKHLILELLY